MPALTDIARLKRLAELFALALKLDPQKTPDRHQMAVTCLMEHGLSTRQAEQFLDTALTLLDRSLLRSTAQAIQDVAVSFRSREHGFVLSQIQAILETGDVGEQHQSFYDECYAALYHAS